MLALNKKNCDVYVGQRCGKMIWDSIINAQKSIKIISPYIEPEFLKTLEQKYNSGLDVRLLTSEKTFDKKDSKNTTIYDFIRQIRTENESDKTKFKWLIVAKYGLYLMTLLLFGYVFYKLPAFAMPPLKEILAVVGVFLIGRLVSSLASKTAVYSYTYHTTFPIKFYANPYENKVDTPYFIHSKIYIIDDVVYLGSFNFTKAGFWDNFETRVKILDEEVTKAFCEVFENISENGNVGYYHLDYFAKRYFYEYIN